MSNRIQLRRTPTPGNVPLLASLLVGEMVINLADDDVFYSDGSQVVQLNAASNIREDSNHRFVTDAQLSAWNTPYTLPTASDTVLGGVKIGQNIQVDGSGSISIQNADATHTGALIAADWAAFNAKQSALGYVPVNKAGDTLLGALILFADPTAPNEAATKSYVDSGDALKLDLTGGTLSGPLVLAADPVATLGAATKGYVDSAVNLISGDFGSPVQTLTLLSALAVSGLSDKQMRLVEDSGAIFRYDVQSSLTADGVDVIVPDELPVTGRWVKIQAATQSHNALNGLQGGSANDFLHLTTAEKNSYDAHIVDAVKHLTAGQSAWLGNINASAVEVNYLVGVTGLLQTQLDAKQNDLGYTPVNKAGDTMLGDLVLLGDPTTANMAATKNFVETFTVDGGVF